MSNILILSCGTRNKIVQYFRKALGGSGKVIATDMSRFAPALYEADKFYIVPHISHPDYIDILFDICKDENIKGILSLIDPELSIISRYKKNFLDMGVIVIGSDYELCNRTLNKMDMFYWLKDNRYNSAESYSSKREFLRDYYKGKIDFPVIIKPICGSASSSVIKVNNMNEFDYHFIEENSLMIQEFMHGTEIGVDCYIDLISGELVSIFAKKKILMRSGETDKSVSFKDQALFDLVNDFVIKAGYKGQIDIDIFDVDGTYYISEVNPRFGGGYPHAYECGVDHMSLIRANLQGISNDSQIGNYQENIVMMKYNDVLCVQLDV